MTLSRLVLCITLFIPSMLSGSAHSGEIPASRFAGVLGWDGDQDAAIAYEDGSFFVRSGFNRLEGFGIARGAKSLRWSNAHGYLPSLITEFSVDSLQVRIENFGDRVSDWVLVYSRVSVENRSSESRWVDPEPSAGFVALGDAATEIPAGAKRHFDFVIAIDRFGRSETPWPTPEQLRSMGSWEERFEHMKRYWDQRLSRIAQISTPDPRLSEAYRTGTIVTHIIKDGLDLKVGENGYDQVYDHDAIGIIATLLTQGDLGEDTRQLLLNVPVFNFFEDARWKHAWPWALYLLKTGDSETVRSRWNAIRQATRSIAAARTGPNGVMKLTHAIDTNGYWTIDNWSALTGLWSYQWLATQLGDSAEAQWAKTEYESLLRATNQSLSETMERAKIRYIPASILEPNTENRCRVANDANWAAHFLFGRWAWDGWLLGAPQSGVSLERIDDTYDYGLKRLREAGFPAGTFGGYPGYSSGYNAGYGAAALRGERHRDLGIRAFQFMIDFTQSAPYGWWESNTGGPSLTAWEGNHPTGGVGSSPHAWGYSVNSKVLLESIAAEFFDGTLLLGRGVPDSWMKPGLPPVSVENWGISGRKRMSIRMRAETDRQLLLELAGETSGKLFWDLPLFRKRPPVSVEGGIYQDGKILVLGGSSQVRVTLAP